MPVVRAARTGYLAQPETIVARTGGSGRNQWGEPAPITRIERPMRTLTIAAGMLLCAASALPALAQEAPANAAPGSAQSAASFTDDQLKGFAQAAVKIQIISQQARVQMMQAVESIQGLDMDTYNGIVQQAQVDPALSARISQFMQDYAEDVGIPTIGGAEEGDAE